MARAAPANDDTPGRGEVLLPNFCAACKSRYNPQKNLHSVREKANIMSNQQQQRPAEMAKAYEAQQVEQRLYEWWESCGFFTPKIDPDRTPFVISLPPPLSLIHI